MNRGAARQATFHNDNDRRDFTGLWSGAVERFGIVVLAYAWMGNHFHALVCSPEGQLSTSLQYIAQVYTQRFNRRHARDGALFRGRFHSILVDSDNYLDRVARYIERNPFEAGLVDATQLMRYRWSSLHHYLRPTTGDWVTTQPLLDRVGGRHAYLNYVLSSEDDPELKRFYSDERHSRVVLGKEEFVAQLPEDVQRMKPLAGIPPISLEAIEHAIQMIAGGLTPTSRLVALQLGQQVGRASGRELADRYEFNTPQSVYNALEKSRKDPDIVRLSAAVLEYLDRRVAA